MVMTTSARQLGGHLDGDCGKGGEAPQRSAAELGRRKTTGVRMFERSLLATVSMWQTQRGLAVLMYIDTTIEHDTTRRLKIAIESYAEDEGGEGEDQYDIALQAQQKADMDTFLHEVRNEQIRLDVLNKPDAVIMCTEIEGQPARVKCEQCKDFFSLEGFAATHATGKRKNHTTVKCEQTTCSAGEPRLFVSKDLLLLKGFLSP
ncbi:Ribonuclease H [Durusdinium trenchii]|uniref:Ribonuclease H n=1 Tax=Durusdinium trenchii TaxID=1381693 RepID=A0ABP0N3J8_9DINO